MSNRCLSISYSTIFRDECNFDSQVSTSLLSQEASDYCLTDGCFGQWKADIRTVRVFSANAAIIVYRGKIMKCLYYLAPTLASTRTISDDLHAIGVKD